MCGCPVVGPDLPPVRDYLVIRGRAVFDDGAARVQGRLPCSLRRSRASARVRPSRWRCPERLGAGAAGRRRSITMAAVAARVEEIYRETLAATSGRQGLAAKTPVAGYSLHVRGIGEESTRRRMRQAAAGPIRPDWINADLHIHSNYSKDCVDPGRGDPGHRPGDRARGPRHRRPQRDRGGLPARELAEGDPFVIVAEEVKTAEGEVIGLFLKEAIPPALSFDETLSLIKEQGGLVYVPHPFDALRTTPSYRALVDNLHRIDVIEIYNAKVALSSFNLSAERFAAKYNIVAGAGSDAHVLQGLGTAMIRMPRFDDPQSFMAALWEADIIARRKSLLYLQSLKLLQTTLDRVLPED